METRIALITILTGYVPRLTGFYRDVAVDETYERIVAAGATPVKEPATMPWGQRTAFFADPDGHIHELFADLPDENGTG